MEYKIVKMKNIQSTRRVVLFFIFYSLFYIQYLLFHIA